MWKNNIIKENDSKLNLKQIIIRYYIEPARGTIKRDEYETQSEPIVGVAFERECGEAAILHSTRKLDLFFATWMKHIICCGCYSAKPKSRHRIALARQDFELS